MDVQQAPSFHPAKRRKFIRNRRTESPERYQPEAGDDGPQDAGPQSPVKSKSPADAESRGSGDGEAAPAMGDILRFRKSHRWRGGIGFSAGTRPVGGGDGAPHDSEMALAEQDGEEPRVLGMENRFVANTGHKVDVDKHMMSYIESEMARRGVHGKSADDGAEMATGDDEATGNGTSKRNPELRMPQRQPAALGKLHEIDLGPDTKLRNIARTEAATRRLADSEDAAPAEEDEDDEERGAKGGRQAKKTRAENDEKGGRGRRRRNSDDVRRDQLVEEVLRESKLDVYQEPAADKNKPDDGQAADDRIAEQFRRDFLDAIQSRRRGARARGRNQTKGGKGKTEAPRGPKLGGSRSARAAMREKQNQAAAQKK